MEGIRAGHAGAPAAVARASPSELSRVCDKTKVEASTGRAVVRGLQKESESGGA